MSSNCRAVLAEPSQASVIHEQAHQGHLQGRSALHFSNEDDDAFQDTQWQGPIELASLSTAQPRAWQRHISTVPRTFIRQILGLNPFKTSYFALYRPLKDLESRAILITGILLAIASGVPLPLIGFIFGKIINHFPPAEDELRIRLAQLMGVAVAYFLVVWGTSVCWGLTGERLSRKLREELVERAMGRDLAYFDVENPDMTHVLTEKTQLIQLGTSGKVGLFIASISYFIGSFTVGFTLNARLTGILLGAVIPSMTLVIFLGTKAISRFSKLASVYTEQASSIAESAIRAVQVVQAFGISERLSQDHVKLLRKALRAGIKKGIVGAVMLGSVYFVAYAANSLAFWEGNRQRERNSSEAGTIYAVVFLILDASFVVGQFGPFIQTFALAAAAGNSIFSILDHPSSHIDVYSDIGRRVDSTDFQKSIHFQDVTFVYPTRPALHVLHGVNLSFPTGKTIGIVGPSGSGKSTISALLLRLYDPSSGSVRLGGDDIRGLHLAKYRSNIALVNQHPVLFKGSILQNILHGLESSDRERKSEEELNQLCLTAASDASCDFFGSLPSGIRTTVNGLSGGQKQRIALARALIGNPALLILDEYTSAMDARNESAVLKNLQRSSSHTGRTTIIIAHRLATVKHADKIVVMKEGCVVEQGQHDVLMKKQDGIYADLIKAQTFEKSISSPRTPSVRSYTDSGTELLPKGNPVNDECQTKAKLEQSIEVEVTGKQQQRSTTALVAKCFSLSRPEAPFIGLGLVASIIAGALIVCEAIIFGNLVPLLNGAVESRELDDRVDFFCLMFFILALVALSAYSISGIAFGVVSENLILRVRDISFRTILSQDIAWFLRPGHSHHDLMSKMNMDAGHLSGLSGVILGTIFSVLTSVLGGIVLAHIVAFKIAIVLLAAVPVMLLAGFLRLRILAKAEERHHTAYNAAAALASEACSAIQTVAALGREKDVLRLYKEAICRPYEESLRFIWFGNILLAFSLSVTYFVYALAYWWGSKQVRNGSYSDRDFFIVLPALLFSAQASGQMFSLAPEITRAQTSAQSVFHLHDQQPTIITSTRAAQPPSPARTTTSDDDAPEEGSGIVSSNKGELEFRSVSLIYGSRPHAPALCNVSFIIRPGQYIAFVGRSGAGKSSAVSIIERFYDPTVGVVLLDGKDIRSENVEAHRARLGLVEQEPDLFPGSIRFNVGLGARPGVEASHEAVESVCKKCGLHEFIMSLPEGYNTECGSNGSRLSGGQRQRLAIARALIRDPEILVLDEATSQLDSNTEKEVRKAIAAASSGRTTIMVAHRLASVQHADRIFVFDEGRIIEEGRHDELVSFGGVYASMVAAQELT